MWTKVEDSPLKKGGRSLLSKALKSLPYEVDAIRPMRDEVGLIGFETADHFVVAKKSPYGDIVSVDTRLWNKSVDQRKPILMYLDTNKTCYEFLPWDIKDTQINHRGRIRMTNFSIREGRRPESNNDELFDVDISAAGSGTETVEV